MTPAGWLQIILFFLVLLALVKPVGAYMANIYQGERTFLSPVVAPIERGIYRISGVRPDEEMTWQDYAAAVLIFFLASVIFLFILLQSAKFPAFEPHRNVSDAAGYCLQHGGQLCHQHKLAELWR